VQALLNPNQPSQEERSWYPSHVNRCGKFRHVMNGRDITERPTFCESNKRAKKAGTPSLASRAASKNSIDGNELSIRSFAPLKVDSVTRETFQKTMAYHYFVTGPSFQCIEDSLLGDGIRILRPDDGLFPNRQKLGVDLLEERYRELSKKVNKYLTKVSAGICLITDGWSNVRNKPIVDYMASSPAKTFFLESVSTGGQPLLGDWIASDISRVLSCFDKTPFVGAFTDNIKTNKKARVILREKYPTMLFQSCTSHGLDLIVKDIFAAKKAKKGRDLEPTYPDGFSFESLVQFAYIAKTSPSSSTIIMLLRRSSLGCKSCRRFPHSRNRRRLGGALSSNALSLC
jgi:Protein of unknown function (DUF 659)